MADSGDIASASPAKDDKKAKKEKEKKKKEDKKQKKSEDQSDTAGNISSDNEDVPSAAAKKEDKKKQKEDKKQQKEQEKAAKKQAQKDKKKKTSGSQSGLEASADEGDNIPTTSTKKEDKKKKKEKDKAAKKAAKNEKQSGNPSGFELGDSSDNDELPSATEQDKKKQKKEDKAAKKKAKQTGNQAEANSVQNLPPIGAIYTDIQLEGVPTNVVPSTTTATVETGQAKQQEKNKDKAKKNDKKTGKQPQAAAYNGMQIDDFQETPSCFSKLSNPLKKKDGYDFSSTAESIQYQEVPVTIENAPSNTKSVMEVKVQSKGDGSLPPSHTTAPPNQHVTYTENQTYGLPESKKVDTQAHVKNNESDVKKYEDRIKKLEAENSKHEAEMKASKAQLVTLTKERDDILERKVETQSHVQNVATDVKKYEDRIKELEAKNSKHEAEMKASKAQVVKLTKERDDITERLSNEWNQKASAADESNVENINIKNRPLKLAEEYGFLCSDDWLEAKTTLDEHSTLDESDKLHLLCDIILQAEDLATKRYEEVLQKTVQDIMQPFSYPYVGESSLSTTHSHQNEPDDASERAQSEENGTHILTESVALEEILQQFNDSTANELDSGNDQNTNNHGKSSQPGQGFTQYVPDKDQVDDSGTDYKDKKLDMQTNHGTSAAGVNNNPSDDDTNSSNIQRKDNANSNTLLGAESNGVPSNHVDLQTMISPKQKRDVLEKLKVLLGDMMRESADYINVTKACQAINENIAGKVPLMGNMRLHELQPLQMYVTSCLQFAWKMALQRPPMVFSTEGIGHPWTERSQEVCHGSDNPHSLTALVVLYRSPALLHGYRLLVKGNVLVKEQTDLK